MSEPQSRCFIWAYVIFSKQNSVFRRSLQYFYVYLSLSLSLLTYGVLNRDEDTTISLLVPYFSYLFLSKYNSTVEANRGGVFALVSWQSAALSSATQHAMRLTRRKVGNEVS